MLFSRYRPWRRVPERKDNGPLRCSFVITSMPVGGAETLLVNMLRRMDPTVIKPEVVCLKEPGPLGEQIADEFPIRSHLLGSKWDLRVLVKLVKLFYQRRTDVVITVGAGDKMFWGRLAAHIAGVPVIASALHSTGWPDGVGRLNRLLTRMTDAFIAVASSHSEFLTEFEKFPEHKVHVIRNGIDCSRFAPDPAARDNLRLELGLSDKTPLIGIVAALRSEKNHLMLIDAAAQMIDQHPEAHWVVVGDGPERVAIENRASELGVSDHIHLLGTRHDTDKLVAALDVFTLCSLNEASPVSILEALACEIPVVATDVGSVSESIISGETGYLIPSQDANAMSQRISELLLDSDLRQAMGRAGRELVIESGSLDSMVAGYQQMATKLYDQRVQTKRPRFAWQAKPASSPAHAGQTGQAS